MLILGLLIILPVAFCWVLVWWMFRPRFEFIPPGSNTEVAVYPTWWSVIGMTVIALYPVYVVSPLPKFSDQATLVPLGAYVVLLQAVFWTAIVRFRPDSRGRLGKAAVLLIPIVLGLLFLGVAQRA